MASGAGNRDALALPPENWCGKLRASTGGQAHLPQQLADARQHLVALPWDQCRTRIGSATIGRTVQRGSAGVPGSWKIIWMCRRRGASRATARSGPRCRRCMLPAAAGTGRPAAAPSTLPQPISPADERKRSRAISKLTPSTA